MRTPARLLAVAAMVVTAAFGPAAVAAAAPSGALPGPTDAEAVQAVADALQTGIRSVTARVDVDGGSAGATAGAVGGPGIRISLWEGPNHLTTQTYNDVTGAHLKADLPAGDGTPRTTALRIEVTNGSDTVNVPWTAPVHPLYRITVSDLYLKLRVDPPCDPAPHPAQSQPTIRWVAPDGSAHEASASITDRTHRFTEFVATFDEVDATDTVALDWYERDPGEPVPAKNFIVKPLTFAENPTSVSASKVKEGGGDCAALLNYHYTWELRRY